MELINNKLCNQWCADIGTDIKGDLTLDGDEESRKMSVVLPESYGRCASLVVSLSYYFEEFNSESLFWMRQWEIGSPELENIGLLLLKQLRPPPDRDSLWEFPGHLCRPDDAEHVRALLLLAMVNPWDATWIEKGGQSLIKICHDGWAMAATRGPRANDIVAWLESWEEGQGRRPTRQP